MSYGPQPPEQFPQSNDEASSNPSPPGQGGYHPGPSQYQPASMTPQGSMQAPAQPSIQTGELVGVLQVQLRLFLMVLRGHPGDALNEGERHRLLWPVVFGVTALATALLSATTAARTGGFIDDATGGAFATVTPYFMLSFGQWILMVFLAVIVAAACHILRALTFKWTIGVRGETRSLAYCANVISVSYAGVAYTMAPAILLLLIPGLATGVSLIVGVILSMQFFMAELVIYIGLNRTARFERSPLVPHVLLTAAWAVMTMIIAGLSFSVLLQSV